MSEPDNTQLEGFYMWNGERLPVPESNWKAMYEMTSKNLREYRLLAKEEIERQNARITVLKSFCREHGLEPPPPPPDPQTIPEHIIRWARDDPNWHESLPKMPV